MIPPLFLLIFFGVFNVANTVQAKKRARQSETSRRRNASDRSLVRTCIKRVVKAIEDRNQAEAEKAYQSAVPVIDRMATKGIIHRNKAARHKSRLLVAIKKLS